MAGRTGGRRGFGLSTFARKSLALFNGPDDVSARTGSANDAYLYGADASRLSQTLRAFADSGQPGMATIFVYSVNPNVAPSFFAFVRIVAERSGLTGSLFLGRASGSAAQHRRLSFGPESLCQNSVYPSLLSRARESVVEQNRCAQICAHPTSKMGTVGVTQAHTMERRSGPYLLLEITQSASVRNRADESVNRRVAGSSPARGASFSISYGDGDFGYF